jgi:solute:Na+ symporter, SSS family
MVDYLALTYGLSVPMVVGVFIFAMACGYYKRKQIADTESFITARKSVGYLYIAWSFYAGAVGAWVIASPASYAAYAGMLGLVFYSLASGLPFIMIAFAGEKIRTKVPHVLSLTDYMGWRFGFVAKTFVVAIILFNMSIALLAEYSTIGSIFKSFVGSVPYPMIILIGILTSAYTAYGGLLVSIYTDQVQGVSSLIFFGMLAIYMAATFRPDSLPTPMPCSPNDMYCISGTPKCSQFDEYSAANPDAPYPCPISGYSSIFVMPASLFAATVFSEAMWQRVWASKDKRALHKGAIIGAIAVILIVFFAGFCGLLAAWAGLLTADTDGNLYLFQVLAGGQIPAIPTVANWIGAICVVCASVMSEGAVDSIQNGMAAAITSYITPLYKKWSLNMTRILVLGLNIVLMIVAIALNGCFSGACGDPGFLKVSVLQLFLIANMLACCVVLAVLAGIFDSLQSTFGGGSFLFASLFPILCVSIYGVNYYNKTFPEGFDDIYTGKVYRAQNFNDGMFYTWIGNGYAWQFFLVPLCVSLGSILLCIGVNFGLKKLNRKQLSVAGFVAPATHPDLYSADVVAGLTHPGDSNGDVKMPSFNGSDDKGVEAQNGVDGSKEGSPVASPAAGVVLDDDAAAAAEGKQALI